MPVTHAEIAPRFDFRAVTTEEKRDEHTWIRRAFRRLADEVVGRVPAGRERVLAVTAFEEAMFWANAGIGRPAPEQRRWPATPTRRW